MGNNQNKKEKGPFFKNTVFLAYIGAAFISGIFSLTSVLMSSNKNISSENDIYNKTPQKHLERLVDRLEHANIEKGELIQFIKELQKRLMGCEKALKERNVSEKD